jgi:hypothetical protein
VPFTISFKSEYSAHAGEPHDEPGTPTATASGSTHIVTPWVNGTARLVVLQGTGQDFEDGTLPELSLAWSSDRAGALGSGVSLPVDALEPGWHTITLTVVDSSGQRATSTQRVFIGERVMLALTFR